MRIEVKLFCLRENLELPSDAVYIFKNENSTYHLAGEILFIEVLHFNEVILVDIDGPRFGYSNFFVGAIHPKHGNCNVRVEEIKRCCKALDGEANE